MSVKFKMPKPMLPAKPMPGPMAKKVAGVMRKKGEQKRQGLE